MTIASAGYQQTVSEVQWSRLFDAAPYWCDGNGGFVFQVTGTRTVQVTDGAVFGRGVRDVIAANGTDTRLVLAPPSSGGQWYLIVLRREWGTAATKGSKFVVLNGPVTDGTVPVVMPSTIPTGTQDTNFLQNPGVKDDQALAWVHVRAADTNLTFFDLRALRTGSGNVGSANFWGLLFANLAGLIASGTLWTVLRHTTRSGGSHIRSTWQRDTDGTLLPVGTIETSNQGAVGRSARDDVTDIVTTVPDGTLATDRLLNIVYRRANGVWREWMSDWFDFSNFGIDTGLGSGGNATNKKARWRWVAGRVRYSGEYRITALPSNDLTRVKLPVNSIPDDRGADAIRNGYLFGYRQGTGRFLLAPTLDTPDRFYFSYYSSTGTGQFNGLQEYGMYINTPVAWAANDVFAWDFEYDAY